MRTVNTLPFVVGTVFLACLHFGEAEIQSTAVAQRESKCVQNCTQWGTCNEELGRCDCPRTHNGPDCSAPLDDRQLTIRCHRLLFKDRMECVKEYSCLNACNYRGRCISGWCHCRPGFYGADCSLSLNPEGKPQLLAGTEWQTRTKRPWVYVYELPPELTTWLNYKRLDRPTHNLFWQRLLSSGARTADGDKADWFFIPVRQRGMGDQTLVPKAIEYIKANYPWWDKHGGGGRHFVIHTGDLGMREANIRSNVAENITWLTHWGLHKDHKYSDWDAAHRVGKDVVIPVYVSFGHFKHFGMANSPMHPNYNISKLPRDQSFFFAGRICGDRKPPDPTKPWPKNCGEPRGYSAGVRQAVHHWHHNRTGWRVATFERRYDLQLSTHKWCLAPLGGGHGQRQIIVSFMGCLPVTIGDNVMQPFEPELDWAQFGLQPLESSVPTLHEIIDQIDDETVTRMQKALRCAAQHMVYSTITGGFMGESGKYDAFETTLEVLRAHADNPGTPPQDLAKVDQEFKRFMACGADEIWEDPPEEGAPPTVSTKHKRLCSHSFLDGVKPPTCAECLRGVSPMHGMPGGAICCGTHRDLSKCPRLWQ